jgi:hypothetical protein
MKDKKLSMAARMVILNSFLNTLPMYYMQVFKLPQEIIDKIISLTRRFLWRNNVSLSRRGVERALPNYCYNK